MRRMPRNVRMKRMKRRGFAALVLALTGAVAVLQAGCGGSRNAGPTLQQQARTVRDVLHAQVAVWCHNGALARPDGSVYATDVTQLAIYAAMRGDAELYDTLRTRIVDRLVAERNGHTFVAWRYHTAPDKPLDASGTTEALRAAEALWRGGETFGRPDDRALPVRILRGYAQHAWTDRGVWLVRNYYNLQTNTYATNSYLVDYDPDLLRRVAEATEDDALRELARRSAATVRRAVTEAGLLHPVIQPELATLTPTRGVRFSPNNVVQLSNAVTVAERSVVSAPDAARGVWRFASARLDKLHAFYNARTGDPVDAESRAGLTTYAPLLRLAVHIDRHGKPDTATAQRALLRRVIGAARPFAADPIEPKAYTAGEALLALQLALGASE